MIDYDEMSDKYNSTNKVRKITMFVSGISFLIIAILDKIMQATSSDGAVQTMGFIGLVLILLYSIHGIIHSELLFKGTMNKIGGLIGLFICLFILTFAAIFSGLFVIIDTILFILKKPLIYFYETSRYDDD